MAEGLVATAALDGLSIEAVAALQKAADSISDTDASPGAVRAKRIVKLSLVRSSTRPGRPFL